ARFAVELQTGHPLSEKGQALLELGTSEVGAEAEVWPGPERQRLRRAAGSGDVELLGSVVAGRLAVRVPGGRDDHRAGRELDVAELDWLDHYAARERRNRLEAQDLLRRPLELLTARHHRDRVELALEEVRELVQAGGVLERGAHDRRDHQRRIGLGERGHEVATTGVGDGLEELREEAAHRGPIA